MSNQFTRLTRRAVAKIARRTPYLRDKLRELDDALVQNAELRAHRHWLTATHQELTAAHQNLSDQHARTMQALSASVTRCGELEQDLRETNVRLDETDNARRQVIAQLQETDSARQHALAQLEQTEKARQQVVTQFEEAEKARQQAATQFEEAEKARRLVVSRLEEIEKRDRYYPKWREDSEQRDWAITTLREAPQAGPLNGVAKDEPAVKSEIKPKKLAALRRVTTRRSRSGLNGRSGAASGDMKISIVLPNYNHGAFIKGNIDGVRAQTYRNWELVIVDDGSTDDSRAIIQSAADADPRIVPIFLPENRGAPFAAATGLAAATGTLIYGSASDDYISNEQFFELVVDALTQHPEACGAFAKASVIDEATGKPLWQMGSAPIVGFMPPQLALRAFLTGGLFVPGAAAIWKRSYIDALGGFDDALGPQADFFINHALPALAGAVFIDETVTIVRVGETNYHRSASEKEFFERHGLIESKLRSLNLPFAPDPRWLSAWRDRTVNARLAVRRQQEFFDAVRATLAEIEPWERESLMPGFTDYSSRALAEVARLEKDLATRVLAAYDTFDTVAGPIPDAGEPTRSVAP